MMEPTNTRKPPRSEKRQRHTHLIARCTPDEKAYAQERAKERGLTFPDYLRALATGTRPLRTRQQADNHTEAVILLKAELNRIGSNINQVAKLANATGSVSAEQVRDLIAKLGQCYDKIIEFSQP